MVYVDEAGIFYPTFQVPTRRTVAANLIASCNKHATELENLIVIGRTFIFAVSHRIEILQLNPASRNEISDQSTS